MGDNTDTNWTGNSSTFDYSAPEGTTTSVNTSVLSDYDRHLNEILAICIEIGQYGRIIIPIVGLVGNMLALLVFSVQLYQRKTSSSVYFIGMAVGDSIVLFCAIVFFLDMRKATPEITSVPFVCSLTYFLSHGAQFLSAWSLVALSIDRLIAVTRPFKFKALCTARRSIATVLCATVVGFGYCTHYFETYHIVGLRCVLKVKYANVFLVANSCIRMTFYSFLPSVIMIVNSAIIIKKLREKESAVNISSETSRSKVITRLLLIVTFFFLIFSLPTSINNICIVMLPEYRFSKLRKIITSLAPIATSVNHAANFYLYIGSGSAFRGDTKAVLYGLFTWCGRRSRNARSTKSIRGHGKQVHKEGARSVSLSVLAEDLSLDTETVQWGSSSNESFQSSRVA